MSRQIYIGKVSRTNDPEKLGRIRVKCPALAATSREMPIWIEPMFPFTSKDSTGWFFVPEVGAEVELEVVTSSDTDETPNESFITNPDIRYRAGLYSAENKPAVEFATNYPKRRGFKTPGGSLLLFDDSEKDKSLLQLKLTTGEILQFQKDSIRLALPHGEYLTLVNGTATIDAAAVKLGAGATEAVLKGDTYRSSEDSVFTALNNLVTALIAMTTSLAAEPMLAPTRATAAAVTPLATALATALAAFSAAAATYKSTKVKVE